METALEMKLLTRDLLAKRVADSIRETILTGEYKLGQRLREAALANQFGVSHIVIREAFHILQGEGIIVTAPHRGRSVFNMGEAEAKELIVLRAFLESMAAYWAAVKLEGHWAEKISSAAARMKSSQSGTYTYKEWVDLELDFHRAVWGASKCEWFSRYLNQLVIPMLSLSAQCYFGPTPDISEIPRIASALEQTDDVRGHQQVTKAILNKNPKASREAMILSVMGAEYLTDLRREFFSF